ncbi:MAG TPA: alpha/beta hydrolase [Sphingomicrobium sp.]|nr:alpha/beta hydrolase [Sphingomicrobium sp.]
MRLAALILAALAASTLDWAGARAAAPVSEASPADIRLPHISVRKIGHGSPVVLIPGLSSPRAVWDGFAPELARDHSVYLVQVNGFGGDDPGANLQPGILDGIVADLHSCLEAEHAGPARVVGHSMGGLAALMLAKAHPADVEALMIVDALPYVGDIFLPGATVAQVEPRAKAMRDQMIESHGKPDSESGAKAIAALQARSPDAQALVARWIARADARVSGLAMYEDMTADLRPDMAAIATPITLIYPWSEALPKERADAFYRGEYAAAPAVSFVPIANSGHFVMLDQPEVFAAALRDFVD